MKRLTPLLLIGLLAPAHAETPEQVQQRLQDYRQRVLDTERYVEEKIRREYEKTWKSYGATEVNRKKWKQEKDGSWVTQAKFKFPFPANEAPADRVRFGDSVVTIAQRHNLSLYELLTLNPGLRAGRLVVGTPIRVAYGRRLPLGLKPLGSGGLSWPDQDDFWQGEQKIAVTCGSLMVNVLRSRNWDGWFRPKPETPTEQLIIDRCSVPPNL